MLQFEEIPTRSGHVIARASMNRPSALNALSTSMLKQLRDQFYLWEKRPKVVAVFLDSVVEKAFCAGGDVKQVVLDIQNNRLDLALEFFKTEYRFDYYAHCYPKPLVAWAHGVTMGGGVGLHQAASFRVIDPDITWAMPENSIGFFPDVGASHFLSRIPVAIGKFLAVTGARLNAGELINLSMADYCVPLSQQQILFDSLIQINWKGEPSQDSKLLQREIEALNNKVTASSEWAEIKQLLNETFKGSAPAGFAKALEVLSDSSHDWVSRFSKSAFKGSALSQAVALKMIDRGQSMDLASSFGMELHLAGEFCKRVQDFREGIRALLIDKDKCPDWTFRDLRQVNEALIDSLFPSQIRPLAI